MKVVVKIGGSLFMGKKGPKQDYVRKLISVLEKVDEEHELTVVTGGGELAREYLSNMLGLGLTDEQREKVIIQLVRTNTMLFSELLGKKPVFEMNEFEGEGIIGGVKPGQSTDSNAANASRLMNADLLVKLTNVDGIYDKDPNEYGNAKKYDSLSFEEVGDYDRETSPGDYGVMDPNAMKIIADNKIRTVVCKGDEPSVIERIIEGEKIGTEIDD